jgi:hypothetical protein
MIYAVINEQTNIVENAIVLDENANWTCPEGFYIVDITNQQAAINWTHNPSTKEWTAPPEAKLEAPVNEMSGSAPNVIE